MKQNIINAFGAEKHRKATGRLLLMTLLLTMTAQTAWAALGDTYIVDANGGGQYTTISAAVADATGGETILIKNGEYTETNTITLTKSLTFEGESQDGVRIKGAAKSLFSAVEPALTLTFQNLTISDAGGGSNPAMNFTYSGHDVTIKDCTFDNCGSKYGAIQFGHPGKGTIDGCTFLDTKETQSSGAGAIYISGAGVFTIKNTVIDGVQYKPTSSFMPGVIYVNNSSATLKIENTTITNVNNFDNELNVTPVPARGVIFNKGTVNIKNSTIQGNTLSRYNDYPSNHIIYNDCGTATIEQTVISDNTCEDEVFYNYGSSEPELTVNYCNIQNNTADGIVNENGTIDLEANYWGSNDLPDGVTAATWVVEDNGEYKLNTDEPLAMDIPGLIPEEEPFVLPEGTIYVSNSGINENDGLSEASAIATLAHAVDIAKARENKTATVYMLNGDYTTDAIDISDFEGVSLSIIGQEKGEVIIHGTGAYIFDVYGEKLEWSLKNLVFDGINSTDRTSAALVLYSKGGNFTVDNCNFRNINSKLGAIAIGNDKNEEIENDNGNTNITNCIIENVTGCASSTAILTVNGNGTYTLDNVEIKDCKLDENFASSTTSSYLRSVIYVNTTEADVKISNSKIHNNSGPMMSLIESRSKLTIENTTISDNVVNTSANEATGGDNLIRASNDAADINISQCTITNNTIVKSGIGLFYNLKGSINVEYSDISKNTVDKFIGSTGTITADNNWWGTNDQPGTQIDKWVIMNVEADDSELGENNEITLSVDFFHVKTASGPIEELTGGEIPKDTYDVEVSAEKGEITPTSIVVNRGEVGSQTFTVTELSDVITLTCDGAEVTIPIEGVPPYRGIIYVRKDGDDNNDGSEDAPVATIGKALELALANGGSGEIIINEGTYVGNDYHVTGDLTVTGVGDVTLDADNQGRLFYMNYGDAASKIELSNLKLTNATGYGAAVYSFANELILDNDSIDNTEATGYLIYSKGKLTVKDSHISNSKSGDVIQQNGNGDILIQNSVFKDNVATGNTAYAVINLGTAAGNLVIKDSKFINNTARLGVIKGNYNYNFEVTGTEFSDNTNTASHGGAIYTSGGTLVISDCVFENNKAAKSGGAIYVGYRSTATIVKSIFVDNTANTMNDEYYGDAIYDGNKLTVSNSVLLTNSNNYLIYSDGEDNIPLAQNCWWGTNEDPSSMNGAGTYEDDWGDEFECLPVDVSNWATMDANFAPADAQAGEEVTVTATFSNANLPDGISVAFTSTSGNLNTVVLTEDAQASTTYTIDETDAAITATSGSAVVEMPIVDPFATNIVTQDNFYDFFDEDGILKDAVPFDELIFQGEFSDLAAGYVIITKPITITGDKENTGDKAVLNNMGFVIASENVALNGMTLTATTSLGSLITVTGSNVDLTNLDISYIVEDEEAIAIDVRETNDINISNNNIYFESHVSGDEGYATAINLEDVEDVIVDGNIISASVPALYVETYDLTYFMMGLVYVNPIRIYEASGLEFTNNDVNVTVNESTASYPTTQAMYIVGSEDVLIQGNDFTMTDTETPEGTSIYLYAVECGFSDDISFIENNFDISTTGCDSGSGCLYVLQVATTEATIIGNHITSESNGPNLGIISPYGFGPAKDLTIEENVFNITGLATGKNEYALISGIEIETGYATISDNTIYVHNKDGYNDSCPVSGISAVQYIASTFSFDIQDNVINVPDGKYAVDIRYAPQKATVIGNALCAHDLTGDDAVYIKSGDNNTVENNLLGYVIPKTGENTYNIPANVSSFKVYDDGGRVGKYSPDCNGTLTLTAPEGCMLQLSGTIKTEKGVDYLTVYDGSNNEADVLINQVSSTDDGTETAIETVTSTGRSLTFYFRSDKKDSDDSEFDGLDLTVTLLKTMELANDADNTTAIYENDEQTIAKVTLKNRTLYKDGEWNTLCLPFDVDLTDEDSPLYGAIAKTLTDATMTGTHVTLTFSETPVTTLSAGVPYIIKWNKASDYEDDDDHNIVEPVFTDVTILNKTEAQRTIEKAGGHVKFIGYYDALLLDPENDTDDFHASEVPNIYYMTTGSTLKHTGKARTLMACRAYFQFSEAAAARQFVLNFGNDTQGIDDAVANSSLFILHSSLNEGWYTVDGRNLDGKPTKKGLYIQNGRVAVIK